MSKRIRGKVERPRRAELVLLAGAIVAASCTIDQVEFGGPEGLKGKELPPRRVDAAAPTPDAGPLDIAAICAPGVPPSIPDADACAKNTDWKSTIYPNMKGAWRCGETGCHIPDAKPPFIYDGPTGADATWAGLVAFKKIGDKRYVDPCTNDPTQSAIMCNLNFSTGQCGLSMPQTLTLGAADRTLVENWLKCGAPP